MTRQSRLILIVGGMSLVGIVGLALLAGRYRDLGAQRSIRDVPVRSEVPETPEPPRGPTGSAPAAAEAPTPPEDRPPGSEQTGGPSPAAAARTSSRGANAVPALEEVDGFVAVRSKLKEIMDGDPKGIRQIAESFEIEPDEQGVYHDKVLANMGLIGRISVTRKRSLEEVGLSPQRYDEIRTALAQWKSREREGVDPALAEAFDLRRGELERVDLGRGEDVDRHIPLGERS